MSADNAGFGIGSFNDFYPTPRARIDEPVDTPFAPGDLVRILVGPANGMIGEVVVERNGNYVDREPYCGPDSIGVHVVEPAKFDPKLRQVLGVVEDTPLDDIHETAVRWFGSPDQMELIMRPSVIDEA